MYALGRDVSDSNCDVSLLLELLQLGFYSEAQDDVQTQVVFHPLRDVCLSDEERQKITSQFVDELSRDSQAVHSLPKYQHNLIMLREDALMFYWSQSLV